MMMLKILHKDFVNWDSPPIYDIDIKDEDLVGDSLSYNQKKKCSRFRLSLSNNL
jgi:hypothetical protein